MRSVLVCFSFVIINCFQSDVSHYKKALALIVKSEQIKEYKTKNNDFHVSPEITSFHLYAPIFEEELKIENDYSSPPHVVKLEKELLKLNEKKFGTIKIFFSEQKHDVFFAEVFISKTKKLKFKNRPVFGEAIIYMFKMESGTPSLVVVKGMHYN